MPAVPLAVPSLISSADAEPALPLPREPRRRRRDEDVEEAEAAVEGRASPSGNASSRCVWTVASSGAASSPTVPAAAWPSEAPPPDLPPRPRPPRRRRFLGPVEAPSPSRTSSPVSEEDAGDPFARPPAESVPAGGTAFGFRAPGFEAAGFEGPAFEAVASASGAIPDWGARFGAASVGGVSFVAETFGVALRVVVLVALALGGAGLGTGAPRLKAASRSSTGSVGRTVSGAVGAATGVSGSMRCYSLRGTRGGVPVREVRGMRMPHNSTPGAQSSTSIGGPALRQLTVPRAGPRASSRTRFCPCPAVTFRAFGPCGPRSGGRAPPRRHWSVPRGPGRDRHGSRVHICEGA